jgi:hypothetical protein
VKEHKFLDEGVGLLRKYGSPGTRSDVATTSKKRTKRSSTHYEDSVIDPGLREQQIEDPVGDTGKTNRTPSAHATYVDQLYGHFHQSIEASIKVRSEQEIFSNYEESHTTFMGHSHGVSSPDSPGFSGSRSSLAQSTQGGALHYSPEGSIQSWPTNASSTYNYAQPASPLRLPGYGIDDSLIQTVTSASQDHDRRSGDRNPALKIISLEDDSHEIFFLLRHFSEVLGPWYFSS